MAEILSQRDLDFLLYEWLQVEKLTQRPRFAEHSRETFSAALETSQQIATEHFYPINKLLDANEPSFDGYTVTTPEPLKHALKHFVDAGLMSAGQDFERGGMQLPHVLEKACFAWFSAASAAASGYPMLTIGNANVLLKFGTPEQQKMYVEPMLAGRFFGTMCLSEPQAGSSLSDIRTRAVKQPDGTYRLFGNKMWISGGEHEITENIVHLVLAKIVEPGEPIPAGVKSISLFAVPKKLVNSQGQCTERNDVSLAGLNHKMGYRGTTNCLLNFGEGRFSPGGSAGAIGTLVGAVNQGLACMFHMMNEARIGVGIGAVTLGYAGYLHSLEYARNRPQGRLPLAKDAAAPQVPIIEHADVRRMLLAQKSYVEGGMALELYCARLVDEWHTAPNEDQRTAAFNELELLTPVAKSWPSQWCLEANSLAIQVHGGYGYTRDYNVEQYYRDNRLNPIHEGTHGIQGLDLLGRKVRLNNGQTFQAFQGKVFKTIEHARSLDSSQLSSHAQSLEHWAHELNKLLLSLARDDQGQARDPNRVLANASVFLEAFGHYVVGWLWLEQVIVATKTMAAASLTEGAAEHDFYSGKLAAAKYFEKWELSKLGPMIELMSSLEDTPLNMKNNWF